MSIIQDGTGTGSRAKVRSNRLFTSSITESQENHANELGDGYNINSGTISLTGASASGVLYLKNNEDRNFIVSSIAVGLGSGTQSDSAHVTFIKNPSTGTLISGATAVDINVNRNFSSSKTLTADAYKGADGNTVTNGTNAALFYATASSRLLASLDIVLGKGDSAAITIDPNLSSGSINVYAAIIGHLIDASLSDI